MTPTLPRTPAELTALLDAVEARARRAALADGMEVQRKAFADAFALLSPVLKAFDPSEKRGGDGRWTAGGANGDTTVTNGNTPHPDHDASARDLAAGFAAGLAEKLPPGVWGRVSDKVVTAAAHVYGAMLRATPAALKAMRWFEELGDTPHDLTRLGYAPATAGTASAAGAARMDPVRNATGGLVSTHVAATVASHLLGRAYVAAKRKLSGQQKAYTDGYAEAGALVAEMLGAVHDALGLDGGVPTPEEIAAALRTSGQLPGSGAVEKAHRRRLVLKAVTHAPKGGATVNGKEYAGGEFIPASEMAKASDEEKAALGVEDEPEEWDGEIADSAVDVGGSWAESNYAQFRDEDGKVGEVYLEEGKFTPPGGADPVPVFRFVAWEPGSDTDRQKEGDWTTDRDAARDAGEEYARDNDNEPRDPEDSDIPDDIDGVGWGARDYIADYTKDGTEWTVRLDEAEFEFAGETYTAYRWTTKKHDDGEWTLDKRQAIRDGKEYAADNHEEEEEEESPEYDDTGGDPFDLDELPPPKKRDVTVGPAKQKPSAAKFEFGTVDRDEANALIGKIFGGDTPEENHAALVASLGMPDDATVKVTRSGDYEPLFSDDKPKHGAVGVRVQVSHPKMGHVSRFVGVDHEGKRFVKNEIIEIKKAHQGEGLGADIFAKQVEAAASSGIEYIETHAAGSGANPSGMNGYATWPKFGYDQSFDDPASVGKAFREAKRLFPQANSVLDLFDTQEGEEWWSGKKNPDGSRTPGHGSDLYNARFDLDPAGRSMARLRAYAHKKRAAKTGAETKSFSPRSRKTTSTRRASGSVLKAWESSDHPRDDHGRFVSKDELNAAKTDPKKAAELRQRVTDPEQRKKLDAHLGGGEGGEKPADDAKDAEAWEKLPDGEHMNDTFAATRPDGSKVFGKTVATKEEADAEEVASRLAAALGVPSPRSAATTRGGSPAVVSDWLDAKPLLGHKGGRAALAGMTPEERAGHVLLTYLAADQDRGEQNYMLGPDGRVHAIDHGGAFDPDYGTGHAPGARAANLSAPFRAGAKLSSPVPKDVLKRAAAAGRQMVADLRAKGMADAADSAAERVRVVEAAAALPTPTYADVIGDTPAKPAAGTDDTHGSNPQSSVPDRVKASHDAVRQHLAGNAPDKHKKIAELLHGHTVAELHELKRQLGLKASGNKADLVNKISLRAAGMTVPTEGFTGRLRGRDGSVQIWQRGRQIGTVPAGNPSAGDPGERVGAGQAHGHIRQLHAAGTLHTPDGRKQVADLMLNRMTVADLHDLKRRLGLKASGRKAELVRKLTERAGGAARREDAMEASARERDLADAMARREPVDTFRTDAHAQEADEAAAEKRDRMAAWAHDKPGSVAAEEATRRAQGRVDAGRDPGVTPKPGGKPAAAASTEERVRVVEAAAALPNPTYSDVIGDAPAKQPPAPLTLGSLRDAATRDKVAGIERAASADGVPDHIAALNAHGVGNDALRTLAKEHAAGGIDPAAVLADAVRARAGKTYTSGGQTRPWPASDTSPADVAEAARRHRDAQSRERMAAVPPPPSPPSRHSLTSPGMAPATSAPQQQPAAFAGGSTPRKPPEPARTPDTHLPDGRPLEGREVRMGLGTLRHADGSAGKMNLERATVRDEKGDVLPVWRWATEDGKAAGEWRVASSPYDNDAYRAANRDADDAEKASAAPPPKPAVPAGPFNPDMGKHTIAHSEYRGANKPWVARVTGTHPKYGLNQEFVDRARTARGANMKRNRDDHEWDITEPGVYRVGGTAHGGKGDRTIAVVPDGSGGAEEVAVSVEDAKRYAQALQKGKTPDEALRLIGVLD